MVHNNNIIIAYNNSSKKKKSNAQAFSSWRSRASVARWARRAGAQVAGTSWDVPRPLAPGAAGDIIGRLPPGPRRLAITVFY